MSEPQGAALKVRHNPDHTTRITIADACVLTLSPEQLDAWAAFFAKLAIFAKALRGAHWQQVSDASQTKRPE